MCHGEDTRNITNRSDCHLANYKWVRHKYNFDNLGQVGASDTPMENLSFTIVHTTVIKYTYIYIYVKN